MAWVGVSSRMVINMLLLLFTLLFTFSFAQNGRTVPPFDQGQGNPLFWMKILAKENIIVGRSKFLYGLYQMLNILK